MDIFNSTTEKSEWNSQLNNTIQCDHEKEEFSFGNFTSLTPTHNLSCYKEHEKNDILFQHKVSTAVLLGVAYGIVFIIGLIGNIFVIAVILKAPRMRTVTNYFIANLAVADILVIVFCLPANLISSIYNPWMLGWFMCKSFTYVQTVSVAASVNSLIAISIDRFLAICFPLRAPLTKRTTKIALMLIWTAALATAVPMAVFFDIVPSPCRPPDWTFCVGVWPNSRSEQQYFLIAQLLLCYLLPLALISACYSMIWIKVSQRSIPVACRDASTRAIQQRSKIKVVKMLAVVVLLFALSWMPLYVIFARRKLGGELSENELEIFSLLTPIAQWLGVSNSCINPVLYAFFNTRFRFGFAALVRSGSCLGALRMQNLSTYRGSSSLGIAKRPVRQAIYDNNLTDNGTYRCFTYKKEYMETGDASLGICQPLRQNNSRSVDNKDDDCTKSKGIQGRHLPRQSTINRTENTYF